jgi:hypothetical protein
LALSRNFSNFRPEEHSWPPPIDTQSRVFPRKSPPDSGIISGQRIWNPCRGFSRSATLAPGKLSKKFECPGLLVFFLNGHLFADYIEQVDKFPDYFDRRYFRLA